MQPIPVIVLGYGIRGRVYADVAAAHPGDFKIVGMADPVARFPEVRDYPVWKDWREALAAHPAADAVIVALPDREHVEATVTALEAGYHVLLEKPIGCSWEECRRIGEARQRARKIVLAGYVLRFSPHYRKLAELLAARTIGDITSIHHLVAVSYGKASHAFCRGNWSVEGDATGMLVNKCSHDFDLIEWWARGRKMRRLASFGSLMHWRPENRPAGAAERCRDCPAAVRAECPFDAKRLYLERNDLRYHFPDRSDAAMREVIANSRYGRCVYAGGNDSVDHQTVLMEYEGGMTVTLEMESFSAVRRRETHFYGTRGEIVADDDKIEIVPFLGDRRTVVTPPRGAHGGGDEGIMSAFAKLIRTASPERYAAIFNATLESHRLAFLAERSRKNRPVL